MKKRTQKDKTSYTYYEWDPQNRREIRHTLTAGSDGITEDWIILLQQMDHEEELQQRYADENADYHDRNYKTSVYRGNDAATDPMDKLAYEMFLHDSPEDDSGIDKVRELIRENLSEDQIDLVYDIYGMRRKGTEIAAEQGVSQQAVDGRNKRIKDKVRKLLEG